ncbi:MAG: translesion DNA synthesis-associated protein ImuA [Pseudomonadota bacterium]
MAGPASPAETVAELKKKLRAQARPAALSGMACHHPVLDAHLPGGWPRGELTEILLPFMGLSEMRLLAPALKELTRQQQWIALVGPPHPVHAAALSQWDWHLSQVLIVNTASADDSLWAMEQGLRSGVLSAVLCWLAEPTDRQLRRLQLAAERGGCAGIVFRPLRCRQQRSPAALRMALEPNPDGRLRCTLLKHRGADPRLGTPFSL